ncbi:MAG: hypothetical protein FWG50_11850 [Kiritimatiellaeota bacterium]|nr:hypothetical protein [Kiritimatiellota bacterium]
MNPAMSLSSAPSALPARRIRLYAPCVAAAACCAALAGMSATLHEGRLRTAWNVEEAPCRIVARKTGETFALARVPATVGDRPVAAVRVFYSTNELPASVIWADADEGVTILADVTAASRGANLRIYPVPGDALATPAPADARVRDPTPLWGVARRTGGMDFPRSMDDVRMLETRFDRVPRYFAVADFAGLPATATPVAEGGWVQTGWDRPNHLVDLQTWLLVPADASLRFGLVGTTPAWLLLDGEPVLEHPARRAPDAWTASNDLPFKAGLHRVQVRTACRARIDTALAWKRAGEEAVAADVVMVTGSGLLNGRTEWRDHRIHPYAGVEAGKAYRFAGIEGAFVPFTCVNETTLAQAGPLELTWHMGGAAMGEGPTNTVTLRTTGLPAEMKLAVRAGEEAAEHTAQLTFDGPIWAEYDVTSRMTGIPAVCYPDDVVQPIIRVRTTAPDGTAFALETRVDWCAGGATNITAAVATASGWAQVYLCPFEAAAAASLTWELRHAGAAVSSGKTVFAREPFGVLPDAVSGDTLKAGDDTVVLVAANASRGEPVAAARRGREVALLDGFLASEAGLDESSVPAEWNRLDLRALERREGTAGMTWLVPFAEVKGVLPAATIVYAPSVSEAGLHGGVDAFARRVAAMAGLLSGPACGSPRVILVVPPEFDVLPGCGCVAGESPCSHAAAAGAYAEAIIRVADVYALETVNLYNAFKTLRSADTPFVRDGGLTPQGASMALGLIFKKIRR